MYNSKSYHNKGIFYNVEMRAITVMNVLYSCLIFSYSVVSGEILTTHKPWIQRNLDQHLQSMIPMDIITTVVTNLRNSSVLRSRCGYELNTWIESLQRKELWAIKMLDANAKPQAGILEGNFMQMGNYEECIKIDTTKAMTNITIKGKYCTAIVNNGKEHDKNKLIDKDGFRDTKITYGFCIPTECTADILNELANTLVELLEIPFNFHFYDDLCDFKDKPRISTATAVSSCFLIIVAAMCIGSTLYDILFFRQNANKYSLWIAFSFYTNGQYLFSSRTSKKSIGCLNGLRVLSMMFIVLSHVFMYSTFIPLINLIEYAQGEKRLHEIVEALGSLAVDTFFVAGGFLVSYNHSLSNKSDCISIINFYLHRFVRLIPSLAVVVLFYATIYMHIGSGPFWPFVNYFYINYCKENWWSTLLFVQNYVHPNEMCISQSWYLAVDTQLYILAPIILHMLSRMPKCTIRVLFLLILASCCCTFAISWFKQVGPALVGYNNAIMKYVYVSTYTRCTPWLMGFILGYAVSTTRNCPTPHNNKLKKSTVYFLWCLPLPLMLGVIAYDAVMFTNVKTPSSIFAYSMYNATARLLWSAGVCAIIFLCDRGHGGVANNFLSHRVFTVLMKLNYNVYLLHFLVIMLLYGQARAPSFGSVYLNMFQFCGAYTVTTLISVIWTLAFEYPVIMLEMLLKR